MISTVTSKNTRAHAPVFTGNIFVFQSFDVGDDIDLESIKRSNILIRRHIPLSKYFKNYHIPLSVELPHPHSSPRCISAKIHNFGVISLRYQIPFTATLEELRSYIHDIDSEYNEQSINDARTLFHKIKQDVKQPKFFHLRTSYMLIQLNTEKEQPDIAQFKQEHGAVLASLLRFETETLAEDQKNEILDSAIGYYRGDLIIIDTEVAVAYDDEIEDKLDIFEFANILHCELQYFDRALDKKLNLVYEGKVKALPWTTYVPVIGSFMQDPVGELDQLKVEISVITDRLENSIKLVSEPYYAELYNVLAEKLDISSWRESLNNKLAIIHDISAVHQNRIESSRDDFLSLIIIILIMLEIMIALFK